MADAKKRRAKSAKAVCVKPDDTIPAGTKVTDVCKKVWTFGREFGSGGCGVVYEGSDGPPAFNYVIKIEYHENGPLFTEIHVYHTVGKQETINQFTKKKHISFLGIPVCYGTGSFSYNGKKYRFLVLRKYGKDLQRILDENGNRLHPKTVFTTGIIVMNVLEYMHSVGYVHGDIKAGNLLLGPTKDTINDVYLLDMGLATRYVSKEGEHKSDKPNPNKANNGTAEFLSRDAHSGVFSRRSDMEILGYNMLLWLSGSLPWIKDFKDLAKSKTPKELARLKEEKDRYMNDVPSLMKSLFGQSLYPELGEYLENVNELGFDDSPNYDRYLGLFRRAITRLKHKNDGILILKGPSKSTVEDDMPSSSGSSQKENNGKSKGERRKRTDKGASTSATLSTGEVLTPAMLAVLNRQQEKAAEKAAKKPRKKAD